MSREEFLTKRLEERSNEVVRLRAALEACAADWISVPGTVMSAAQCLASEFRRRMNIAAQALEQS
jgi:hypothetical protein